MDGRGAGQPGGEEAAAYIETQFKAIGLQPGWKVGINSSYDYRTTTSLVRPLSSPQLALLSADGSGIERSFQHQLDFGYVIDGHGGSGQTEAPLTFIAFQPGEAAAATPDPARYNGLNVRGRIVMLVEDNAPDDFVVELLRRGAQRVLWATADSQPIHSQIQLADPDKQYLRQPTLPIFRLREETADLLLQPAGLALRPLLLNAAGDQSGPGWTAHELETRVAMSLRLETPQTAEIVHVLGFYPGYDDDLVDQLLIVFAPFDGLGLELDGTRFSAANHGATGAAILLETARLWQENKLDPRRSVLFVAWGGGRLPESGAAAFLEDDDNFRKLSARVNTPPLRPVAVFQIGALGAGGAAVWTDPAADRQLLALWRETAATTGLPLTDEGNGRDALPPRLTQAVPTLV